MNTLIIGLSGGIGSGKTAVSDRLQHLGITIVDADICARIVVEKGQPALKKISTHFGEAILNNDGSLDRAKLREKIFSDAKEKKWLEALLHPLILDELFKQLSLAKSPYCVLVSPLLVESGQNQLCEKVLIVDTPEDIQIKRTMQRDQNSEAQIKAIMATQANREQRLNSADFVILNDGSLEELHIKVDELHEQFLALASHSKS